MNLLSERLTHELNRPIICYKNFAVARSLLEDAIIEQYQAVADGLLANLLLRGKTFADPRWWYYYLSRLKEPNVFSFNAENTEFQTFKKTFINDILTGKIKPISLSDLSKIQIRLYGGTCQFDDEGKINYQLSQLGSELRLVVVGSDRFRLHSIASALGRSCEAFPSTNDGRFILGNVHPLSTFGGVGLYIFLKEIAISPYFEIQATGFIEQWRIIVRQFPMRATVEAFDPEVIPWENGQVPYTVAEGMAQNVYRETRDDVAATKEFTTGILFHEWAHASMGVGSPPSSRDVFLGWRDSLRDDLLRYARIPRYFEEFEEEFGYLIEATSKLGKFGQISDFSGCSLKDELEQLERENLLLRNEVQQLIAPIYSQMLVWEL